MLKNAEIQQHQPEILKEYREFQMLAEAENPELTECWTAAHNLLSDQFIDTLTENGCKRWEKILDIHAMGMDTLQERRFRIKARINETLPYTYRRIEQILNSICGVDGYEMVLFHKAYTLMIKIELTSRKEYEYIKTIMKRVAPANLLLDITIRYNQHYKLKAYRHRELSEYTQYELREKVWPEIHF